MSYRDTARALEAYRDRVTAELQRARAACAEARARAAEVDRLEKELAETRALLDQLGPRRVLGVLQEVRIAAPCHESWEQMKGNERVRFCGRCEKNVYNVSAMSEHEAEALLISSGDCADLCLRLYRRADGTVLTGDCPVGVRRRRRRAVAAAALGGGLMLAGSAATSLGAVATMGARSPIGTVRPASEPRVLMGQAKLTSSPPDDPTPEVRPHRSPDKLPSPPVLGRRALRRTSAACVPGDPLCTDLPEMIER
jgi:hypothetical protein